MQKQRNILSSKQTITLMSGTTDIEYAELREDSPSLKVYKLQKVSILPLIFYDAGLSALKTVSKTQAFSDPS